MYYLLLVYTPEGDEPVPATAEDHVRRAADEAHAHAIRRRGIMVDGLTLHSVATATTVRVRGGAMLTTDGPFAETQEQLGGFYLVDVEDLDAAISAAAAIPEARFGSIEIRPVDEPARVR
jgi:hypothetical protein